MPDRDPPVRDIARIVEAGVTQASLEGALGLSAGYLSKIRNGAVRPGAQLALLLRLLARHPALLRELGIDAAPARAGNASRLAARGAWRALELLRDVAPDLTAARIRWVVGGATALAAYGIERDSRDVDVFVRDADRKILTILRDRGAAVGTLSSTSFLVYPAASGSDADRIDLVFVKAGPLATALRRPALRRVHGAELPLLRAADLALQKLMSHSQKDEADARALVERGVVDVDDLRARMLRMPAGAPTREGRWFGDRALGAKRLRDLR